MKITADIASCVMSNKPKYFCVSDEKILAKVEELILTECILRSSNKLELDIQNDYVRKLLNKVLTERGFTVNMFGERIFIIW